MSDIYSQDISIGTSWVDLTTLYPAMVGVPSYVQNKGLSPVLVAYTASSTQPTGGGTEIGCKDVWPGTAAHCWVRALTGKTTLAVGIS